MPPPGPPGSHPHLQCSHRCVRPAHRVGRQRIAIPGLSTGLTDLDRAISGLNKSDLILLAARPGMGKTSMALNILLEAERSRVKMWPSSRWK